MSDQETLAQFVARKRQERPPLPRIRGVLGAATLARMPDGWLVIVSYKQPPFDRWAPKAVPEGFVLTGFMNETVMVSEVRGFRDGAQEWAVVHDPDVNRRGVQVDGAPPEPFTEIYRKAQERQATGEADVDYIFDVPIDLSAAFCGFTPSYDMDVTWMELIEVKPQRAPKEGKGFFARLFGR